MKQLIKKIISATGFEIKRKVEAGREYDEFMDIYRQCEPYSMTGLDAMYALYKAIEYIVINNIEGDFVECGIWRGGSSMLMAKTLQKFGDTSRRLYLFDTFSGMSSPTDDDMRTLDGAPAQNLLNQTEDNKSQERIWAIATLGEVRQNMQSTGYDASKIFYAEGKVEDTLPQYQFASPFALVRLDTDWYESTKVEMNMLYPKLVRSGVLIIDDYGHWSGAKKAVDEYISENKIPLLLNRIDYTVRIGVKG